MSKYTLQTLETCTKLTKTQRKLRNKPRWRLNVDDKHAMKKGQKLLN